ncbi:DUF2231 domain-containing protein [Hydrogenophaga sp. Root209]|uniref:DUF2231 domain-containing protein n=1 Tax=Hydrogenophaga sp. Root209 TaxID=1736490 RepID=UPI000AFCA390|nr:DUF2231 domain-containing protein [Hydrogenophaga sp. Root209]
MHRPLENRNITDLPAASRGTAMMFQSFALRFRQKCRNFCRLSSGRLPHTVRGRAELPGTCLAPSPAMNRSIHLFGHPVHQLLVLFPGGLLFTAVLVDLCTLVGTGPRAMQLAHDLLALALAGGLFAAPFGWLDWRRIPRGTRARRVGALHGGGNAVALGLFALSWFLREAGLPPSAPVLALSLVAGACMLGTVWLGGELVTRLGVGVHVGAYPDAPGSHPFHSLVPPRALDPDPDDPSVALLLSVAGEEDPGAAVDSPAPPEPWPAVHAPLAASSRDRR